ncbi:TOMM precursor leader peptide-binding protein [Streptomyces cocklensis]|uniref:Bacteriocin biosynthesis cyclodehydratase domain-containing protein n=1 Tax=Actinacidiphila cocklensis TaxID=887465 RepID=A0A9W4E9A7_9ACTN|nr:TOMM precursor leader peptide-binding protein [Actinacidiphila cocklensis]MDD1059341.1 TOMM precursor leader peptide-binding protein [Actinacidiphila cocklensis]CAG6396102.1 Bacteriocin biosynthesis cyclodehydratase domain-containing protein [Actinacidiphila cocklensis]
MVSTYDELAGTRPRIRRDVLYTQTPTGVHFHNARGGFSVVMPSAYRFATLMVPHLTGDHTVAALCEGLGDKQREMVVRLVGTLYARGFARDAVPADAGAEPLDPAVAERFAAQVDYIDHYTDGSLARFRRFRQTRVAVVGDDAVARWAALSLIRNGCAAVAVPRSIDRPGNGFADVTAEAAALRDAGCAAEVALLDATAGADPAAYGWPDLDGYDMVLVTGADAPRRLAALLDAGIPAGRLLLPAWPFGDSVVIGPLMSRGAAGCWTCAALRLGTNGEQGAAADLWSAMAPGGPRDAAAPAVGGPLAAMIGNLLGYEVFRRTTGVLPAETENQLLVQHTDSLDTTAQPLLPHPRCPYCSAAPESPQEPALLAELLPAEPAEGEVPAQDAGAVSPLGGPVGDGAAEEDAAQAALAEISGRAVLVQSMTGVFAAYADEDWAQTPLKVSTVVLGVGHRVRREVTAFDIHHVAGARLRALQRAAEVYAEHVVPDQQALSGAELEAARGKWRAVEPSRLSIASGLGTPAELIARWSPATSLLSGETLLVPAAALRPFGADNQARVVEPTSAGTGAGVSPAAAVARGLRTALAHDALRRALGGTLGVGLVAPDALDPDDAEITFLLRSAEGLDADLEILELGGGPGECALPVVLARAADPATGAPHWAVAAGLRRRDAVLAAVRDLLGAVQTGATPDLGDPLLADLDPAALVPNGEPPAPAAATDWPAVATALRAAGRDVLAVPAHTPDLAAGRLHAARILLTTPEAHR